MPCCFSKNRPPAGKNQAKAGFALVLSLTLMAFLMLMLISLSTLIRMETATTQISHDQAEAEQNALMGLKVALGQLQKLAGPDQRITAPANIDPTAAPYKEYWTGVWQSGSTGGATDADFKGWLVSLPEGMNNTVAQSQGDVTLGADWVQLVGEGTVDDLGTPNSNFIAAGKVSVNDTGHYAYWTGEENTKARVNLSVPADVAATDPDLMAPRYTGFTAVDTGFGDLLPSNATLAKLTALSELDNLADVTEGLDQRYFHDLSIFGRGVQADVKNGGLKKDLTHLLESDRAFEAYFGIGPTASPTTEENPGNSWPVPYTFHVDDDYDFPYGAPNWGILASYYRLYNDVSNGSIPVTTPLPAYVGSKSAIVSTYHDEDEQYQYNQPVHAVTSMFRIAIALGYELDPDDSVYNEDNTIKTAVYKPVMFFKPLIALYNPYDITLNNEVYNFNWYFMPKIEITITDKDGKRDSVEFSMHEVLPEDDTTGSMFRWRISQNTDLRPGETRYYALDEPYILTNLTTNDKFAQMEANWNENGAYYVNLVNASMTSPGGAWDKQSSDPFIHRASVEGRTVCKYSSDTERKNVPSEEKSDRFGFTQDELNRLTIILEEDDTVDPEISVEISYEPANNSDEKSRMPYGYFSEQTGRDNHKYITSQIMDGYYQEFSSTLRPKSQPSSYFLSTLTASAHDLAALSFSLRTTEQTDAPQRQLIEANPRAIMNSGKQAAFRGNKGLATIPGWTMHEYGPGEALEPQVANFDRYTSFWGNTRDSSVSGGMADPATSVVLFHVPREPLISVGSFQHAGLGRYAHEPAYIFGNSYIFSKIPANSIQHNYDESSTRSHYAYDWSYVLNNEIWDSYYFSTVPQDPDDAEDLIGEIKSKTNALPNPHLSLYEPDGYQLDTSDLAELLTDDTVDDTAEVAAAFQLTEGSFNVNSTSVEAWKAFLASNSHLDVPIYNPATGTSNNAEEATEAIFFRTPLPYNNGFTTTGTGQNFWNAYRKLNDNELTALATAVVQEVRTRGPFSSLGDFVNRRPGSSDPDQQRRGPLQAALDTTVNNPLSNGLVGTVSGTSLKIPDSYANVFSPTDKPGTGMPGWILQGDVLQVLGPLMSVRSDTFRIRAYGDCVDPLTDHVVARAWCEAIVQRVPDPVMPNDTDPTRAQLSTPPTNFGRQFRIVSFRWLHEDDV